MEKLEVLYDHYKETVKLSLEAQQRRGKLFVLLCTFELMNMILLLSPSEVAKTISDFAHSEYEVTINVSIALLQSALWIVIIYIMVRYYQTNIYIERQYGYIATLEGIVSTEITVECFNRESNNYIEKYPKVLDFIAIFYTWIIPVLFIAINTLKIVFEWLNLLNVWSTVFDMLCYTFYAIMTVLYLHMMHPRK